MVWKALTDGLLEAMSRCGYVVDSPRIEWAVPRESAHGDWTTNLALTLAKPLGQPPRKIAEALAKLETVVVIDTMHSETAMQADFVLPD